MSANKKSTYNWIYYLAGATIFAGFILSIISFVELCSEECDANKDYRLFGLPVAPFGIAFFVTTGISHYFSRNRQFFGVITGLLIASAIGAEIFFIWVQKYVIGVWCPVCLAVAASVGVTALILAFGYFRKVKEQLQNKQKEEVMKSLTQGLGTIIVAILGFVVAFVGLGKHDELDAAQKNVKEQLVFGNEDSDIEAYLFTDWACPACQELEARLPVLVNVIQREASLVYVDFVIHPETLNYTPYNLSFIINNKDKYLKLRHKLTELSLKTGAPEEEEVEEIASKFGVEYQQLNYADVALGIRYYKDLGEQFGIKSTPTLVIVNKETKKGKRLIGADDITLSNTIKAIHALQ